MTATFGRGVVTRWILVVDDDRDIRDAYAELLVEQGYAVTTAADGAEALKLLRGSARMPDLILLDLRMPKMSGWELIEAMQQTPLLARVPIVVVSADLYATPLGPVAWLRKPVKPDLLLATIGQQLAVTVA